METKINTLTKEWSNAKIKGIRQILAQNKINKTGRLSKSLKIKIITAEGKQQIQFQSIFYGKYVRAYYLKKRNIDIFGPVFALKELIVQMKDTFKKQIVKEVKETLSQIKNTK